MSTEHDHLNRYDLGNESDYDTEEDYDTKLGVHFNKDKMDDSDNDE